MKKSISYWSFEGGLEGKAGVETVLKQAKAAGFPAVELCAPGGELTFDVTEQTCRDIARQAQSLGIEIASVATGVYWGTSLSSSKAATRKQAVEYTKKLLHIARWLGTDAILVVPGAVDVFFDPASEHVRYDECWKRAHQGIRACVKTAEKLKVAMCLENVWNKFLLSPLEYRAVIDSFGSRSVKAYFDCGNARLNGFPEHWIELLGKRIGRVHWKDFRFVFYGGGEQGDAAAVAAGCRKIAKGAAWAGAYAFCDLGAGDVDWKAAMAAFRKTRYNGYITAEMLPWSPGLPEQVSKDMDGLMRV
jgi:hexulose-6-phosphate isomerase